MTSQLWVVVLLSLEKIHVDSSKGFFFSILNEKEEAAESTG